MRPSQFNAVDIFASSPCPEPGALTLIAFTILSIAWVFCQLCLSSLAASSRLHSKKEGRPLSPSRTGRMIVSLFYAAICSVLLVDCCWLATIYTWAITKLSRGETRGLMDFAFTRFVLAVWLIFLLTICALWLWSLLVTVKRLCKLWVNPGDIFEQD
ncbi:hypothetical protein GGR51DRAFT_253144 [Nemania sp. FL0031]|nr:hypothetical protein GGR51DRAFT_253144 [Nemania sp. FL0031]